MIGASIIYRVPCSVTPDTPNGWRRLTGTITHFTDTAIVVKEEHFGGQSTIDRTWLVMYDWIKTALTAVQTANA